MRLSVPAAGALPRAARTGGIGWLAVAVLIAVPMAIPLVTVVAHIGAADTATLAHLHQYVLPRVLANTAVLVAGVALGAGVLGTLLAWLVAVYEFPGRRFFSWALLLPMAVPGYVMAFVVIGLFDYAGPLQTGLRATLGEGARLPPIRSTGGVILVMVLTLYPYVYLIARNAFLTQGRRALEVGQSLGLTRGAAFLRVALPMARPWLAGGVLLVAMETLADFGTVAAFNYDTFTTAIYQAWFGLFSLPAAMHLAATLIAIVLVVIIAEQALRGAARYTPERTAAPAPRLRLTGPRAALAVLAGVAVLAMAFVLPFAQLLVWSLQHLAEQLDRRTLVAAANSATLAGAAALLIATLALLLSYARRVRPGPVSGVAARVATIGYAVPGPVLAVGVFAPLAAASNTLTGWFGPIALQTGLLALLLAYTARFLAVAHAPVDANMQRVTPTIEDAAVGLGARGLRLLARVHLPILRGGLLTGATLVFVDIMKEMPITLMTRPYGWDTLAVRIFELTAEGRWEQAALPGVVLVLTGLLPVALLTLRGERGAAP